MFSQQIDRGLVSTGVTKLIVWRKSVIVISEGFISALMSLTRRDASPIVGSRIVPVSLLSCVCTLLDLGSRVMVVAMLRTSQHRGGKH